MGIRVALRRVAAVYRKSSRLLVVLLLAATLISPVFAQQPPSGGGTLSIQMSNVQGGTKGLTCLGTEVYVRAI